ncbi:hypothetical protein [Kiloniella antarctica]|uniref:Uncharacterized protein n=1 Tax=Kiloniella antarctica TaxID=1550907 RepID=A0ABW5BJW6_9PROT
MKYKVTLAFASLMVLTQPTVAEPSINNMQGCQALLDFVDTKLENAPASYGSSEIATVRQGLSNYNAFIQKEIITPGLIKFSNGDQGKADALQEQVDVYKSTLVKSYSEKYPQNRLFMDHVVALNNCTKQAVPTGADLQSLKDAMQAMIALTKQS